MADANVSTEAVARSLTQEAAIPVLPATPEMKAAQKIEGAYKKTKQTDPLAALKESAQGQNLNFNIDEQVGRRIRADRAVDESRVPIPDNPLSKAKRGAETAKIIAEGKFNTLDAGAQQITILDLDARVLGIREQFAALDPIERTSIIVRLLETKGYQEKVARLLNEKVGAGDINVQLDAAKKAFEKALDEWQTEEGNGLSSNEVADQIIEFEDRTRAPGGRKGAKLQRMDDLKRTGGIEDEEWVKTERDRWNRVYPPSDPTASGKLAIIENEVRNKMQSRTAITNPDEQAMAKLLSNEEYFMLRNQERELRTRSGKLATLQTKARRASDHLTAQEDRVSQEIENIYADAGNTFLDEEITKRVEAESKRLEDEIKTAKDGDEKGIKEEMKARWERVERRGKRRIISLRKDNLERDFGELIENGPDALIAEILGERFTDQFAGVADTDPAKIAEKERIEGQLKNEEFMARMRGEITKNLVGRHIMAGGKTYKEDIRVLKNTDWGMQSIKDALKANEVWKDEIEEAYGQGVLDGKLGEKVGRWLRGKSDGSILKLLLVLFSLGGLGTMFLRDALKD